MSFPCNICAKVFSTRGNLKRHTLNTHGDVQSKPVEISAGSAVLQHPCTCIVAGCTQSGKTVWVKSLLEKAQKTISPPPQRIIWCYGQWQPSYFDMLGTMPNLVPRLVPLRASLEERPWSRLVTCLPDFGR